MGGDSSRRFSDRKDSRRGSRKWVWGKEEGGGECDCLQLILLPILPFLYITRWPDVPYILLLPALCPEADLHGVFQPSLFPSGICVQQWGSLARHLRERERKGYIPIPQVPSLCGHLKLDGPLLKATAPAKVAFSTWLSPLGFWYLFPLLWCQMPHTYLP